MAAPQRDDVEKYPEFCNERQSEEQGSLCCDLRRGHGGDRHREGWVATWRRDDTDVRWWDGKRYAAATIPAAVPV